MCEYTNCAKAKKADKDIHVWKVMERRPDGLATPIQSYKPMGENNNTIEAASDTTVLKTTHYLDKSLYLCKNEGVYAYLKERDALSTILCSNYVSYNCSICNINRCVLYKAVIPKGTFYWISCFADVIMAKKIILLDEVKINSF